MFINPEAEELAPITYKCSICHKEEILDEFNPGSSYTQEMIHHKICFSCAFWQNIINHPKPNSVVINGHYYIVFPYVRRPFNKIMGSLGKEFYILKHNNELIKSNNVLCKGKIPEEFEQQLPDTAIFLSLPSYMKLKKDPFKCNAKGCWDRYHCVRYNKDCEAGGPFNIIPDSHRPGDEHCPSFINIKETEAWTPFFI